MLRHLRNSLRLFHIAWILARYDALFPLEEARISPIVTFFCRVVRRRKSRLRPGERLSAALQALGPSFIKLGQSLSTRSDLMGEEITADLANLRDSLPPFPTTKVLEIIEEDFGQSVSVLFRAFEPKPVAAASIAQVHFASTQEGREVAVKVLRPEVRKAFARDLELFFWLAELVQIARPELRRLKPMEVVRTFQESIRMELDLRFEASAAIELRQNMAQDEDFYVPEVFWPLTSGRVLTMERINGTSLGNLEQLRARGHDLLRLQRIVSESFFKQSFRDGFFHADMHPGNLFVMADGRLAAVDFGIMGRINQQERFYIAEMLKGFLEEDYRHVAQLHFDAGYVPSNQSVENFTLAIRAIGQPILDKPLHEISVGRLLAQMFQVTETFEMETQPQLLLLQKTMVMVEGVGRMLNPEINMWQMAEPLIQDWAREHLGPLAQAKLHIREMSHVMRQLPDMFRRAERLLHLVEEQGLPLHPRTVEGISRERQRSQRQWLTLAWTAIVVLVAALAMVMK